jgi:type I restriction enzyme, S subunit
VNETWTPPDGWRVVRFDSIMRRVERKIMVDDEAEYATVGVRWYGKGAFIRERLLGADIARKQQWVIRAGDVVYNKLFAWKGSFAVASAEVDGDLVSDKFPTYALDPAQVDAAYLNYFFRIADVAIQAERLSKGAAAISKLTLNPPQFWDLTLPLPDITEQRRLVEILGKAEARISEARRSRSEADAEAGALVTSAIGEALRRYEITGRLGDVLSGKPRNGWSAPCDNAESGTPVLSLGAVTGFTYRPTEFKRTSEPTVDGAYYWLTPGDLLITRSNTERLLGHAAIYDGEPQPCIYPDLMMRIPVDEACVDARFVYYWLQTPAVRGVIEAAGRGTSSTMKKITQADVMNLPFPTRVDVGEQHRAVRRLDRIVGAVDEMRRAQRETTRDLEALFPALLDRACHGELEASGLVASETG